MAVIRVALLAAALLFASPSFAQSKNLAPGFSALPKGAKGAIMPTDIELFSISGGGVLEPKADWTEAAARHFRTALDRKHHALGLDAANLSEDDADELAELNALHAAVARAIAIH